MLCLVLLFALGAGCRRGSAPSGSAAAKPSNSASRAASAPTTPEEEAQFRGEEANETPLFLGPGPTGTSSSDREQRLKKLFSGETRTDRLPLVDTAPNVFHDPDLHARLTGVVFERRNVEVTIGLPRRLSGTLDEVRASRVTAGMRGSFGYCYQLALRSEDEVPTSLRFEIELLINDDGSVRSVAIPGEQPSTLTELFICVSMRARRSHFEPPQKEASRVRFSVDLYSPAPRGMGSVK